MKTIKYKFDIMKPKQRNSKPRFPTSEKMKHPPNICTSTSNPEKTPENLPNEILTLIFEYLTLKENVETLVKDGNQLFHILKNYG